MAVVTVGVVVASRIAAAAVVIVLAVGVVLFVSAAVVVVAVVTVVDVACRRDRSYCRWSLWPSNATLRTSRPLPFEPPSFDPSFALCSVPASPQRIKEGGG